MIEIRDAQASDAVAACEVMRRSITELCAADHHDDPEILGRWLANKTPGIVASWIAQPGNSVILAIKNGAVVGVGAVTDEGHILLNYVLPAARFQGVSRALLRALEAHAIEGGNDRCTLDSTQTAKRFYISAGYSEELPPRQIFGTASYPMSKRLSAAA
jgi:ribosomal protein S18 acetylase RimI-like enzyme